MPVELTREEREIFGGYTYEERAALLWQAERNILDALSDIGRRTFADSHERYGDILAKAKDIIDSQNSGANPTAISDAVNNYRRSGQSGLTGSTEIISSLPPAESVAPPSPEMASAAATLRQMIDSAPAIDLENPSRGRLGGGEGTMNKYHFEDYGVTQGDLRVNVQTGEHAQVSISETPNRRNSIARFFRSLFGADDEPLNVTVKTDGTIIAGDKSYQDPETAAKLIAEVGKALSDGNLSKDEADDLKALAQNVPDARTRGPNGRSTA